MKRIILEKEAIHKGNLILVNKNYPIVTKDNQKFFTPIDINCTDILLESRAVIMLSKLMQALNCTDEIVPVSGYRTLQEQEKIYKDSIRENGVDFTSKFVALPNCSEHQTGLAIDLGENKPNIDFIRPDFPYTGICQRFREKSAQYGFIERYPKDKELITGIACEPWHFRYVGYPHSLIMQKNGITLEEYIDYTKKAPYEGRHLTIQSGTQSLEVCYIKASASSVTVVELPDDTYCQISGNNVDGFIMTLWR
ncbi:M15 family metallopeptidase [Xylanivirga thermophila]|jgi:D-alanyl-D-alanine dipeptidase/carboxypeptidase|uniref:M15 family metallopeptidase n=1 Tax=Xylanivirga thermophila TaxID=2496273 RepID=UPI00101D5965|nr:M15 family metallopeptidase [Xylanivirga thermophila]